MRIANVLNVRKKQYSIGNTKRSYSTESVTSAGLGKTAGALLIWPETVLVADFSGGQVNAL